jgi:hypothetical protein
MELLKGKIYRIKTIDYIGQWRGVYMGKWGYDIYNESGRGVKGSHTFCDLTFKGGLLITVTKKDISNGIVELETGYSK